jgi:hypothetical protein
MKKRIIVVLKIADNYYKFFSILFSNKDASYFIYNHLKDESSSLEIAEPFHLLKTVGRLFTNGFKKELSDNGDSVHISIHPNRIYVKKRTKNDKETHLIEETIPQPFNKDNLRLHCLLTPAPYLYLPIYDLISKKIGEKIIIFKWDSQYCPQVSLYELNNDFKIAEVEKIIPGKIEIIPAENQHSAIVLQIRETMGDPGVWKSNCGIFGKILNKKPISKSELRRIISYNDLDFDISSLPNSAIISDYKVEE